MQGILLFDKPAGISSASALAKVKRILALDKIGHAGTLDPFATGLLICLIGKATRLSQYAMGGEKEYEGTFQFGVRTSTDDMTGEVLEHFSLPDPRKVLAARDAFVGELMQVPPQVSAIHVEGKRAYQLSRMGQQVTLPARKVHVHAFSLDPITPDSHTASGLYRFKISCSSGTYIRSLARDLGRAVGSCAAVKELRRTKSFPFTVANASTLEILSLDRIIPWERLFPQTPKLNLSPFEVSRLLHGSKETLDQLSRREELSCLSGLCLFGESGAPPRGIMELQEGGWRIAANFG